MDTGLPAVINPRERYLCPLGLTSFRYLTYGETVPLFSLARVRARGGAHPLEAISLPSGDLIARMGEWGDGGYLRLS